MMDHPQSASGNGEDNVGIPDDLRCKRSDGKQWRCTAMSMPDKTVCEKHYIQAKKRAANSAMRASMKKGKRNSMGESDIYLESKSDDYDMPIANLKVEHSHPISGKKYTKKASKDQIQYSPETPPMRNLSTHNPSKRNGDSQRDFMQYEENWSSYKISPVSAMDSSRNRSQRSFDINATAVSDYSSRSTESSEETEGKTCHQCRRNIRERLFWCLRCERRGYCDNCISKWYSYISLEDIQKICPACRGTCTCKVCLRGDNLIKMRIKEIPVLNKLQHLHSLLSSVLPIIKRIHCEQCFEVELEKKIRSTEIDLNRTKLNVDEQMCCNFCRIPIVDYHRQCANCSYDLCLSCSQDLREASASALNGELVDCEISDKNQEKETVAGQQKVQRLKLNFPVKFPYWKANSDGSIPCPPKEYGGCGYSSLNLCRIFKMNWVAKLVKNVEEMVGCCRIYDIGSSENIGSSDLRHCQYAHGQGEEANFLYSPSSDDIKSSGIGDFRKHWARGEPIIVKEVFDSSTVSTWDPVVIRSEIRVAADEKLKEDQRMVKAIDCFNWSEVNVELDEFIRGFSEGRRRDNGWPQMLKLRDWPSPTASEEFLLYQRPEFISKLPLVEYIHPRWGFLNVAAKLPHYSLQNDAGPKIFMSYGSYEELGRGDCVTNLHFKIRDMVYLLVHSCEVKKLPGRKSTETEKVHKSFTEDEAKESPGNQRTVQHESRMPDVSLGDQSLDYQSGQRLDKNKEDRMADQGIDNTSSAQEDTLSHKRYDDGGDVSESNHPGVLWDVFHRRDVPKLLGYLRIHWNEFGGHSSEKSDLVTRPLYDETLFLNKHHIRKLKEEFEVEPWSFKQHAGQAVFVPAGCPFQVRNLQSTVQLGLDFLFPESLGEAVKLAEEIRCLPNDHEAKLQVLEVEKISLYAASSAIKEVQKLVLDPKLGTELGFGDLNLTAAVSENLERMTKRKTCA